jgi:anti-sigma regulatory factor (Ser/Thr protein kinase)
MLQCSYLAHPGRLPVLLPGTLLREAAPAGRQGRILVTAHARTERLFESQPSSLHDVRSFIREQAAGSALRSAAVDDLILAVSEACANAVKHTASPEIRISWRPLEDGVEVEVEDEGVFAMAGQPDAFDPESGFGIPIMSALVDELGIDRGTYRRPGTRVRLVKLLQRHPSTS